MIQKTRRKAKGRNAERRRRHHRIRRRIRGTPERPRLTVFRSLHHIEGQIIDDEAGRTLCGLSTLSQAVPDEASEDEGQKSARARAGGKLLAEKAVALGIETVVFDRGGYKYHGRVRAFAEGAREGGLKF